MIRIPWEEMESLFKEKLLIPVLNEIDIKDITISKNKRDVLLYLVIILLRFNIHYELR